MYRRSKIMAVLAAAFVAGISWGLFYWKVLPDLLRRQIEIAVSENCRSCELEIGTLEFGLLPGEVSLVRPRLKAGYKDATEVVVFAERVRADIAPLRMAAGTLHFASITFDRLDVRIDEGDSDSPPSPPDDGEESLFDFSIGRTDVRNARFTYVRHHRGTVAKIDLSHIQAEVGPLGTTDDLRVSKTSGRASAILESSGLVNVEVATWIFEKPQRVEVDLKVRDHDLSDLSFFRDHDGLNLKGYVQEARGRVRLQESKLHSWVFASYKDFDVVFDRTIGRSKFEAVFMNIVRSLIMDERNDDERLKDQTMAAVLVREPKESLVGFILRGLKEAALKVVKSGREIY